MHNLSFLAEGLKAQSLQQPMLLYTKQPYTFYTSSLFLYPDFTQQFPPGKSWLKGHKFS